MRKRNLALALLTTGALLAACKPTSSEAPSLPSSEPTSEVEVSKKYFGFGAVAYYSETARGTDVETTIDFVSVLVDEDGTIDKLRLDTTQLLVSYDADAESFKLDKKENELIGEAGDVKSKWELLDDYGMIVASPVEKEWYIQAELFENWSVGKTLAQIKAGMTGNELTDGETVGVTIIVDTWVLALEEAIANKVLVDGEVHTIGVGAMNNWVTGREVGDDFYVAGAAFDENKNVLGARIDTFQVRYAVEEGKAVVDKSESRVQVVADENRIRGKQEQKEDYDMKGASPIGKEWYEQAESLVNLLLGKKVSTVLGTEDELADGEAVGVTIVISGYRATLLEAEHTAFNARY